MTEQAPSLNETEALLRLLDDQDETVKQGLMNRLANTTGDLSDQVAALGIDLSMADRHLLGKYLAPARRRHLEEEWLVPESGLSNPSDDWESFEDLLSLISEYLHDGVELRPLISDQLDWLAEECEEQNIQDEIQLRDFLFTSGRFVGNQENYYAPQNSDLGWVLKNGKGNPISLGVIYMLLANRLDLRVEGCNFPGHFVTKIYCGGEDYLVDCFHRGELMSLEEVYRRQGSQLGAMGDKLKYSASFEQILRRVLHNLCYSFSQRHDEEDALLLNRLAATLTKNH